MPVPLALALPAAAAGLAYLNVKTALWYDWVLLRGALPAIYINGKREKNDRCNTFYKLEERANDPKFANKPYILFEDKAWTYAQTYDLSLRYGCYLKKRYDLKPRQVVAVDITNCDHFIFLTYGLWSIGVKPAYINFNLTGAALAHCIKIASAVLLLAGEDVASELNEGVRSQLGDLRIDIVTPSFQADVLATTPERPPDELRSGELSKHMAILIYTSGTTGLPKAAIVSWKKMTMAGLVSTGSLGTTQDDIFYTCMPLYHSAGTIMGWGHCLEAGCTFALGKRFSPKTFWKDVRAYDATMIQYVGETCRYLLSSPPEIDPVTGENLDRKHRVRLAYGNGLRPDIWEKFKDRFGIDTISEFYGATEGFLATWNLSSNPFASGAIGRTGILNSLLFKMRTALVRIDPETDQPWRDPVTGLCENVPRGEVGELMFHIPDFDTMDELFQGYYGNSAATNSKIIRDVIKKGDGYFRSGDLVRWDSEGRIFFHDRIGDTFRWKSENVATTEVSQMMGLHPAVHEANVYGVELPNHDGRAGCVAIVLGNSPNPTMLASLAAHAREKLPKYAVPIFLRVNKEVGAQTTGTMKQQKHLLRQEGVDPSKVGEDELYWLKENAYVKFSPKDWQEIQGGSVKL